MALNPKPFTPSQLLRMRQYGPKPSVVTDVDINQEKLAMLTGMENIADTIGGLFQYLRVTVNSLALTRVGNVNTGAYSLAYDVTFDRDPGAPVVPNGNVYSVKTKTVEFELPTQNYTGSALAPGGGTTSPLPEVAFWLWAKTSTINFGMDPAIAGVNGGGFPAPQASSDALVWELPATANLRVTAYGSPGIPAPSGGYTPILRIAHIGYRYIGFDAGRSPAYIYHAPVFVPEAIDPVTQDTSTSLQFQQNAGNGNNDQYGNSNALVHPSLNISGSVAKLWLKVYELERWIKYHHP